MTIAAITIRKAEGDSYIVEMADASGSITAQVWVPKMVGNRIYGQAEREKLARLSAQEIALTFAERLLDDDTLRTPTP